MLQWIRETIRGESRSIMPMLDHLRDRLTRSIGRTHLGRFALVVTGGIFQADGRRFYFEMNNIDPNTRRPRRTFERGVFEVNEPSLYLAGSGMLTAELERAWFLNELQVRPPDWEDHLALLAALNRRAADRDKNRDPKGIGTVSPWCQGSYMAADRDGVQSRIFTEPGDPPQDAHIETIISGIDLTDSTRVFLERARGSSLRDADMEEAIRRGLKGRP
jgi:hypothetical protein